MEHRVTGCPIEIKQVSRMRNAADGPSVSENTRSFAKRVDATIEGFPDRGSTPLASTISTITPKPALAPASSGFFGSFSSFRVRCSSPKLYLPPVPDQGTLTDPLQRCAHRA